MMNSDEDFAERPRARATAGHNTRNAADRILTEHLHPRL